MSSRETAQNQNKFAVAMRRSAFILGLISLIVNSAMGSPTERPTRTPPTIPTRPSTLSTPTDSPTLSPLPESCTYRPTATWFATSGCDLSCSMEIDCVADFAVVLPCGCDRAAVSPTTTTICPTRTPCYQCVTGWGIATVTDPRCESSGAATAAAAGPVAVRWLRYV
ncbi:hypothetical protein VTK26DRAFT_6844 [Humicola hyalothermophila]